MSVIYNETRRIFKLDTENTSYLIGISPGRICWACILWRIFGGCRCVLFVKNRRTSVYTICK